jgi:hypothetical protein
MAHPDIDILRRGVSEFNTWRDEAPRDFPVYPDLSNEDLKSTDLTGANLGGANLTGANLEEAVLAHANLIFAKMNNTCLYKADLLAADLGHSSLESSMLEGANLDFAEFKDANLKNANLSRTSLYRSSLWNVEVENADFTAARFGETTIIDTDLSVARNLDTVDHSGPSNIDISTIYRSKGNIPRVFLEGAGVPENFMTYMLSLTGKGFEFYTCFISFSESDDAFSEQLYNDLQAAGVRCWRWKEDAAWGKTLMKSIDEAVRYYDKLIVICSEQSLHSPAVIREIERALQKEDELAKQGRDHEVLFPIRLDDYIISGWEHHRKADVLTKHIGDFRQWKTSGSYRNALTRLIRDLKTE